LVVAVFEAVTVIAGLDEMTVMCEVVQKCCGQLGIAEHVLTMFPGHYLNALRTTEFATKTHWSTTSERYTLGSGADTELDSVN
jgi:hypothetical protein